MCNAHLDIADVERRFDIHFAERFAAELDALTGPGSPQADGLVRVSPTSIDVTDTGRVFVRNVCMLFDRYLDARTGGARPVFSRTV